MRARVGRFTGVDASPQLVKAAQARYGTHRRSQAGPFSMAEHRAAQEFPLFLALKAVKLA